MKVEHEWRHKIWVSRSRRNPIFDLCPIHDPRIGNLHAIQKFGKLPDIVEPVGLWVFHLHGLPQYYSVPNIVYIIWEWNAAWAMYI